jgi:NAD(P)-dependent dehydrogenase (short-subunit alcohol dehydrogenase family)
MKPIAELLDLTGKSAVVTGGAKGIGAGIAYRLAEAGAAVLVADLDGDGAGKTAAAMAAKGGGPRRPPWTYRARRRWQA